MKSRIAVTCLLAGCTSAVLAGDTAPHLPAYIEVVVRYSELRGVCSGERFLVSFFDNGDGRHTGLIADGRGTVLYRGAPVHAEGCGAEPWPLRTDGFERVGTIPSGQAVTQLVVANSASKTCLAALDLPAIIGPLCAPPNPGIIR